MHEFGIKKWSRIWDVEMGDWCAGDAFAMQPTTALVPSPTPQEPLGGRLAADIEEFPSSSPSQDGFLSGVREKEMRDATTDDKKRRGAEEVHHQPAADFRTPPSVWRRE